MEISVVIPIYRNESQIDELVHRIQTSLSKHDFEVIFINDFSPDNSLQKLFHYSEKFTNIKVINLAKNLGQQKATLEGLKIAQGNFLVVLDGDLQDAPELITRLYDELQSGTCAVFVKRKGVYQSNGRMFTSVLIKRVIQLLSGLHYKAGSYYMFKREVLEKVLKVGQRSRYPYMSIVVAHFGGRLKYVDASRGKSIGGSGYNFGKRLKAALMAVNCSFYCTYYKIFKKSIK